MIFHEIIFFSSDFHNLGINDFSWKQILFSLTSQIRAPSPQWKGQHKSFTRWHGGMKVQSGLHLCRHNIKQVARVCPPLRGLLQRDRQIVGVIPILLSKNSTERTTWNAAISLLFSLDPVCFFFLFILRVLLFLSLLLLLAILLTRILRRSLTSPRAKSGKGTLFSMSSDLEQRLCAIYVLRNLGGSFFLWQFCFWCVYLGEMLSALGKDFLSGVIIFRFQSTYRRSCTDRVTYGLTYFQNLWRKLHELNDTLILPSSKKICRRYPLTSGPSGTRNEELLTQVWEGRWNTRIILNILGITRYLTNTYSSNLDEFVFGRP